jgi:hypothetical protein
MSSKITHEPPLLTTRQLSAKECKKLPLILQTWQIRAYRGLTTVTDPSLYKRLSDCQKMCGEIESLLRSSSSCKEVRIVLCEDIAQRPQTILAAWKQETHYTILKVATCPWNISPTQEEKENGSPTKGAGTRASLDLICQASKEQVPVQLSALASAKTFWENLGFEEDINKPATEDSIPMILSPQKMQRTQESVFNSSKEPVSS